VGRPPPCLPALAPSRANARSGSIEDTTGARTVVRKAILEPDNNRIYAAYTLGREDLHVDDPGRTR
jgi:hypothetical protein